MLSFHPLSLADKPWIDALCALEDSRSADFSFTNMFLWDDKYRQQVCRYGDRLLVQTHSESGPIFPYPIGGGNSREALEALMAHAGEQGFPCVLRGVEPGHLEELERIFPGKFFFCHDRDYDDYLYSAEKLAALAGKKMHGKRNHINRFLTKYSFTCEPMKKEHFPACRELLAAWDSAMAPSDENVRWEALAIDRAFEHFEALGLEGCCLFVEGALAAFAIGDVLSSDTFDIHFEKASPETEGAYPMINKLFAEQILQNHPEIKFINREDDMGLENIRKAKESYRPDIMVEKHSAELLK